MQAVPRPGSSIVGLPQQAPLPAAGEQVVLRRIDYLLELSGQLARLPEALADEESKPGRLPGSFYMTRLPLLLKQIQVTLTAISALGGQTPQTVEQLVADPDRFRHEGSSLILAALDEIDLAVAAESLAPRPPAKLQSAD
jgi:hypothetical protein